MVNNIISRSGIIAGLIIIIATLLNIKSGFKYFDSFYGVIAALIVFVVVILNLWL
jgi:hypothetical protein